MNRWIRRDPLAASRWAAALPEGGDRDSAVSTLVRSIEKDDPEAAVAWAQTIGDEKTRESYFRRIARRVMEGG
jgi:hypothetical protein